MSAPSGKQEAEDTDMKDNDDEESNVPCMSSTNLNRNKRKRSALTFDDEKQEAKRPRVVQSNPVLPFDVMATVLGYLPPNQQDNLLVAPKDILDTNRVSLAIRSIRHERDEARQALRFAFVLDNIMKNHCPDNEPNLFFDIAAMITTSHSFKRCLAKSLVLQMSTARILDILITKTDNIQSCVDQFELEHADVLYVVRTQRAAALMSVYTHTGRNAFSRVHRYFRSDREFVLAVVTQDPFALKFASDELKNDREIVLAAVRENGYALESASDDMKNDREIVLAAVMQIAYALIYASDDMTNDREIVLAAVTKNGHALRYASPELKNDREIVLAAVAQNPASIEFASDALRISLRV
jgi:hypothetical protein